MPNSKTKKAINIDKDLYDRFEHVYPELCSIFLNRSLELALQDVKYFEEVFLNPLFVRSK